MNRASFVPRDARHLWSTASIELVYRTSLGAILPPMVIPSDDDV